MNTGFGCWCYFSAIGSLPVQTVAVCGYLEPLSAVIFSELLLHERLTPPQIVGACLIIGGALFTECVHRRKAKESSCTIKIKCVPRQAARTFLMTTSVPAGDSSTPDRSANFVLAKRDWQSLLHAILAQHAVFLAAARIEGHRP